MELAHLWAGEFVLVPEQGIFVCAFEIMVEGVEATTLEVVLPELVFDVVGTVTAVVVGHQPSLS